MASGSSTYKLFLLPAYVVFETTRALLTYTAIHSGVPISSTLVALCTELCKAAFTIAFLLRSIKHKHGQLTWELFRSSIQQITGNGGSPSGKHYLAYAIPSFLYLVNNILYLLALHITTPATLHVAILAKLPLTAILHHVIVRSQRNMRAWLCLGTLCVGLLVANIPGDYKNWLHATGTETDRIAFSMEGLGVSLGIIIGLGIAVISAFTSIYTEIVLKQDVPFWVGQFWLYAFGSGFGAVALAFWDGKQKKEPLGAAASLLQVEVDDRSNEIFAIAGIVLVTTATGLVVANILRKKDNLVKLVGTSASIVTIIVSQCLLLEDLRNKTWTVPTVIGSAVISVSTWCYHYYKQQPVPAFETRYSKLAAHTEADDEDDGMTPVGLEEAGGSSGQRSMSGYENILKPTAGRLGVCFGLTCLLVVLTVVFGPDPSEP